MASSTPDVSVVAVNYRTPAMTVQAVRQATLAARPYTVEQVVVDNGATPTTTAALRQGLPDAAVLAVAENRGFAAGVNAAVARVTAPSLFIVNPDAVARGDAVARLLRHLERRPEAGVVAPRLVHEDGRLQINAYKRFPNLLTLFVELCAPFHPLHGTRLHPHALGRADLARARRVAHVMGAAMLVRRTALEVAGPFDEGYFLYYEETEWQRRAARMGWTIEIEPGAVVVHAMHGSSDAQVVPPHFVASAQRFHRSARATRGVLRAAAAISLLSARAAAAVRPRDERFPKMIAAYRRVLAELRPNPSSAGM
jgi:N-acetylglucosaminyl-diphospho-decaprenol L-rhamnosyltransferase